MFKQNFVKICTVKGLSPTAVCTAIGLSNSTYSQWTEDSIPRKTTLLKLAEYLEVSVDELLNGLQEPTDITEATVETIHELCRQHHTNPRDMCKAIGIHDCFTTQYRTAGDSDNTIHIAEDDLQKIADYFEVSVGYLLGTEEKGATQTVTPVAELSPREVQVALAYRAQDDAVKAAIDKMLDLPPLAKEGLA